MVGAYMETQITKKRRKIKHRKPSTPVIKPITGSETLGNQENIGNSTPVPPVLDSKTAQAIVDVANGDGSGGAMNLTSYPAPPNELKAVSHELLLRCLYFLYDAFERPPMDFFLVRDTAKQAIAGEQLSGYVEIGVRRNEWVNGSDILFMFFGEEHVKTLNEDPNWIECEYNETPFIIRLYDENKCLAALNSIVYEYETFKLPNMFDIFCKEFDNV